MSSINRDHIGLEAAQDFYKPHPRVDYDGTLYNPHTGEFFTPPDRTKQAFKDECDINNILKQYKATGQLTHVRSHAQQGKYDNLPDEVDFQTSLNTVIAAERAFSSLPSKLRNRFHNDPVEFLEFMSDPANQDEAIELGLATDARPKETPPQRVEIVNPTPQQGGDGGTPPSGGAKAP